MGYDPAHTKFVKVYVSLPGMITKLKSIMEEGMLVPGILDGAGSEVKDIVMMSPYECNVPYVMRYMIDFDITGASWLTLPRGSYGLRVEEGERGTHCQVSGVFCCVCSVGCFI
jgi:DNA polymerase delta subunit 1